MTDMQFGPDGWLPERLGDLSGKTYVITGGNAGTGYQAAQILLSKGAQVVMLNRSVERSAAAVQKLQDACGTTAPVSFVQMDLADRASVRAAASEISATVPRIDALICNAAIAQVPTQKLTVDGVESHLGTNHYGHFLLCGLLFDQIAAAHGRIVVVSSLGYNMGLKTIQFDDMNWDKNYHQNRTYSHSKLAQMLFAYELQDRIKAANGHVQVYVCHPGAARTSLIATSGDLKTRAIFWLMTKFPIVQSARQGAFPAVMCATEDGLKERALYGPTGRFGFTGPVGQGTLHPHAHDKDVMRRLWDLSEAATGMRWQI